jgi:geranylgeranyl pyrophosphate synthase
LDVAGSEATGKAVGVDVRDGTVTVPTLCALDYYGRDSEFAELISRQDLSDREVETAIEMVRSSNAVEQTKNTARSYVDMAFDSINILADPDAITVFRGIGEFVIARYH